MLVNLRDPAKRESGQPELPREGHSKPTSAHPHARYIQDSPSGRVGKWTLAEAVVEGKVREQRAWRSF